MTEGQDIGQNGGEVSSVAKTNLKIPAFEKRHVDIWFHQVESQFQIHNITSEKTRYHYTLSALDTEIAAELTDVLEGAATSTTPYTDLKTRLISIFADSKDKKLKKLLTELELGDKRPTALLREMQRLAGSKAPDDLMKSMFLQHMPSNVRAILATSKDDLINIAQMADKILEQTGPATSVMEIQKPAPNTLEERLHRIESQIAALASNFRGRSRHRSPTPHRSRPRSKSRSRQADWCWYHNRFGSKATKCQQPCKFSANEGNSAFRP